MPWHDFTQPVLAYQGLLIDIQRRSFEAFLDELIVITDRGEPLTNWVYLQQSLEPGSRSGF